MLPIRIKACSESDLRMLGNLACNIQRVLPVTQADIDAAAALGKGWVVWKVIEVNDPIDNLRGGTQLVIKQNSITPGQNVRRVLIVSGPGGETVVIGPGPSPLLLPDAIADSLTYVKAFGGTEQRDIPDNYLQRQFIYMMDGSYLLTDIVPSSDMRIEMNFQTTTMPAIGGSFVGSRDTASAGAGIQLGFNSSTNFTIDGMGSRYTSTNTIANNTRYKFTWNNGLATIETGGSVVDTNTFTPSGTNTYPLVINGLNNAGTPGGGQTGIYLYSFKVWNAQGELIANYVPAVEKAAVPVVGFYDTVSKTFKTATTGTFAAGGEAVPTPDKPIDIISNNGVLKYSPNIFDGQMEQGAFGSNTGLPVDNDNWIRSVNYINVKPGSTYTASCSTITGKTIEIYIVEYDGNGDFIRMVSGVQGNIRSWTTNASCSKIKFQLGFYPREAVNVSTFSNIQVEQGSTATVYNPHIEGIYTVGTVETIEDTIGNTATTEMLLKVGDYQDVQSILDGVVTRKVGVKVLDGTETGWTKLSGVNYVSLPKTAISNMVNGTDATCLSNSFVQVAHGSISLSEECFSVGASYMNFKKAGDPTAAQFKQYLADQYAAGTPVIVIYPLATETTESVAGQTLQVQDGDNTLEITQASLSGLELEAEYEKVA